MMSQAPWTDIGSLQSDISNIQSELRNKGEAHEMHTLSSRMDSMEHSLRELSSLFDGIRTELQVICEDFRRHQEETESPEQPQEDRT